MALSGVTAWPLTARDIITQALLENGIIGMDEEPTAAEANACLVRLNGLLKSWGVGMHLETDATVTVPAGSSSGTIGGDVGEVMAVRHEQSATYQRPLVEWVRDDLLGLPNRTTSGNPTAYYVEKDIEGVTLHIWPVPAADITLKVDFLKLPDTVTDLNQTVDMPDKYHEALFTNLAVRCAGMFGAQPAQELYGRAKELERMMLDRERPSSYYMRPACA